MKSSILKTVILNLLILLFLTVIIETLLYKTATQRMQQKVQVFEKINNRLHSKHRIDTSYRLKMYKFDYKLEKRGYRPVERKGHKHTIVLFGCSYTYGSGLEESQTFAYKLAEQTHSTVYNRGRGGWGLQHVLYQLRRDDFYQEVEKPDYVIYTFIDDHIRRLYQYQTFFISENRAYLRYKEKNNQFIEIDPMLLPLWSLYSVKETQRWLETTRYQNPKQKEKDFLSMLNLLKECKTTLNKHYPDTKFVVFLYNAYDSFPGCKKNWKELEKDGFIVYDSWELIQKWKYPSKDYMMEDGHPTEKAWDEIVPALVKKLSL